MFELTDQPIDTAAWRGRLAHAGAGALVVFEGWVEVPATGVYTLHLRSDDGSRLWLSGQPLIDNDGLHGMNGQPISAALKAGKPLAKE